MKEITKYEGYHKVKRGRVEKVVMEEKTLTKGVFLTKLQLSHSQLLQMKMPIENLTVY
jgi:hypothetical protein